MQFQKNGSAKGQHSLRMTRVCDRKAAPGKTQEQEWWFLLRMPMWSIGLCWFFSPAVWFTFTLPKALDTESPHRQVGCFPGLGLVSYGNVVKAQLPKPQRCQWTSGGISIRKPWPYNTSQDQVGIFAHQISTLGYNGIDWFKEAFAGSQTKETSHDVTCLVASNPEAWPQHAAPLQVPLYLPLQKCMTMEKNNHLKMHMVRIINGDVPLSC